MTDSERYRNTHQSASVIIVDSAGGEQISVLDLDVYDDANAHTVIDVV